MIRFNHFGTLTAQALDAMAETPRGRLRYFPQPSLTAHEQDSAPCGARFLATGPVALRLATAVATLSLFRQGLLSVPARRA
jgi:hypothetical protein